MACLDVGSTFTKGALVELPSGRLLGTAQHVTTLGTTTGDPPAGADVLRGVDAVLAALGVAADDQVLACSSAGGGLRLAVVGYERAVTAEAGHRVGLSAGARVVHVAAGPLGAGEVAALRDARPDVVLLCGGTDGGNAEVLLHNAAALARSRLRAPVVVAGNVDARDEVCALLVRRRKRVIATANVLPVIGRLEPGPARAAIRAVFLRHVIGGKGLSPGPRFARLVRAATPDAVLAGVELLADGAGDVEGVGDVVVVDVGGATTDVYSAVTPDPEEAALRREVVEVLWRGRTVEGDLGMRWSAPGVVDAAVRERLLAGDEVPGLEAAARLRAGDPAYLPGDGGASGGSGGSGDCDDADDETRLAALAVTVALRRHARPPGGPSEGMSAGPSTGVRGAAGGPGARGRDLRGVQLVIGSGGVLRHATPPRAARILAPALTDVGGGWQLPERADLVVDRRYVLAAAGLLATEHPQAAARLLQAELQPVTSA